jgi:hypothetical protein
MTMLARTLNSSGAALALSSLLAAGCDVKSSPKPIFEAGTGSQDAGANERVDATAPPFDSGVPASEPVRDGSVVNARDAGEVSNPVDGSVPDATATDANIADAGSVDAGRADSGAADPLAPFALDCANLPANGTCQGGPREVLLVVEDTGLIAMFEPQDGRFLGYLKRSGASFYEKGVEDYWQATQGPDQCIWSVGSETEVERWNTDGTFRDKPLAAHYLPVPGEPETLAISSPKAIAFTRDKLYVGSSQRLTRWNLDGSFDKVVLDDDTEIQSLEVLGDGSLLIADEWLDRVVRIPAAGGVATPVLGDLDWPAQISYAGNGRLLVSDITLGTPAYQVQIETGMTRTISPRIESSSNKYGIAQLRNGRWLITGGQFMVASLDPDSVNPMGQFVTVWDDPAVRTVNFRYVGRACLPNAVVESRASKPANDTCVEPPAGPVLFAHDFESGIAPFVVDAAATVAVTKNGATGADSASLQVTGPAGELPAVTLALPNIRPSYVRYFVKINNLDRDSAGISLGWFSLESPEDESIASTSFYNGYINASNASLSYGAGVESEQVPKDKWLRIEVRNIDWNARTYDLYVDCKREAEGIVIPPGHGDDVSKLILTNWNAVAATRASFFDDILIK